MGYHTHNVITNFENQKEFEEIKSISNEFFKYHQIKIFKEPFKGIVMQINENEVQHDFYRLGKTKYGVKTEEEVYDNIYESLDNIASFSQKFPDKSFAYIEADCFGGTCMYEGYIIKNGAKVLEQESTYTGHIPLLQNFEKTYHTEYFEPFTRDFFTKKAEIKGEIKDFTIGDLWLLINTDFGGDEEYRLYADKIHVSLSKQNDFYIDFTQKEFNIIISGKLYTLDDNIMQEIRAIIDTSFVGTFEYQFKIYILDTENVINL